MSEFFDQQSTPETATISGRERYILMAVLLLVAVLTISDLYEDRIEGAAWSHLAVEGSIVLVSLFGALMLWKRTLAPYKKRAEKLSTEVLKARADAEKWQSEASSLLAGLGEAIDRQFEEWRLTAAEKDVGVLLLKGLSSKEIANLRETSERTVRHQAAALYAKASLDGRAQLSAFFLEDLLLPIAKDDVD
jgi:DNA-binding CsgD family transcriptional regulator